MWVLRNRGYCGTLTIFQLLLYDEQNYSNDSSSTEPPSLLANFLPRVKSYLLNYNNNYFRTKFGGGFEQQTVHPAMALSKPVRKPLQELNGKTGWSVEGMKKAIEAVATQKKSLRQAAREYGVPATTLKRKIDTSLPAEAKPGPPTVLSKEEEERLVSYIITMAQMGFGLNPHDIRSLAYEIAENSGHNHPFLAGKDWFQAFTRRHKISMRIPQPLSYARAKNANPRVVEEFFDRLSALYARLELSASQIYNADKTGISCVHKPSKVCAKRGQKAVWSITAAEKGRTNTILASGSASGHALPPMIIFPHQRVSLDLMSGAPADTLFTGTTLGWINSVVFFKWFKFFVSQIPPKRPVLLLYDGHASHISTDVIEYAHLHHIEIMCLPAHSSHLLQPLDVAVFKPLKTHFNEACRKFLQSNPGRVITIYDISQLVGEAWPQALTPVNLISGFSNSGIYPLNPAKITLENLAPSQKLPIHWQVLNPKRA